ncbi:hypothetical protein K2173_013044 [Erythroxylum novogranatense]|uniref:PGG domain-containing protein n=1 Tax=Erythroxylum novogranatense TaxID=1862640 RepID=A0AAV8S6Q9_9ROSI|nr:hypothetical protein K2173_013044 [Erythroxylum novogranatense]
MSQLLVNFAKLVEVEVEKELVRMENQDNDTALHDAVRNGHFEIVSLLINEDPGLARVVNGAGESPMFLAVDRKFYKIANHILKTVPMCSYVGRNRMNALHAAIIRADKRLLFAEKYMIRNIAALLSKISVLYLNQFLPVRAKICYIQFKQSYRFSFIGADFMHEVHQRYPSAISEADNFGWIPLHYAAYLGNAEVVELLLGLDISLSYVKDKEGMSALLIAAKAGQDDVIEKFIDNCPDTSELLDNRGRTALHIAAEKGKTNAIKIFLSRQCFEDLINEQDKDGNTPFHLAALESHHEVLLVLTNDPRVDKGATNKAGLTAFDIIKSNTQLKQHKKAQIIWKMKAHGVLQSLKQAVKTETTKVQAIEQPWQQVQQQRTPGKETSSSIIGEDGDNLKIKTLQAEAEPLILKHLKDMATTNLLVATIVATVTFIAALLVPGGYKTDEQGSLAQKVGFGVFMIATCLAFGLSTASIFLHFGASGVKRDYIAAYLIKYAFLFNEWSIYGMVLAFLAGTSLVLAGSVGLTAASVITACCFLLGL